MARYLGFDANNEGKYYFVSYNSDDETAVARYASEMYNSGINMWYDYGIEIGAKWEEIIAENIKGCEAVIMFLSKNLLSKERSYVHKEYEIAKRFAKKNVYIIFIDQIEDSDVPARYQMWWIDVTALQSVEAFKYDTVEACVNEFMQKAKIEKVKQRETHTSSTDYDSILASLTAVYAESKPEPEPESEPEPEPEPEPKKEDTYSIPDYDSMLASLTAAYAESKSEPVPEPEPEPEPVPEPEPEPEPAPEPKKEENSSSSSSYDSMLDQLTAALAQKAAEEGSDS
ncbi:MAG: toll/interleukin-1 receptor domain-containing protein [Oscillospiraceae bacterium]|nr:toll/interleukin-1 receptor domain-containing protein [Oscillospiraceae bacterium]